MIWFIIYDNALDIFRFLTVGCNYNTLHLTISYIKLLFHHKAAVTPDFELVSSDVG